MFCAGVVFLLVLLSMLKHVRATTHREVLLCIALFPCLVFDFVVCAVLCACVGNGRVYFAYGCARARAVAGGCVVLPRCLWGGPAIFFVLW